MAHRVVRGLKWARMLQGKPSRIPNSRPKGAKAAGLRYERLLKGLLLGAKHGQWFEFEDLGGLGWCQTDFLVSFAREILVLECKYTWTQRGHDQIEDLYRPVIERLSGKRVLAVQVCKKITAGTPADWICGDFVSAVEKAREGSGSVWHWLGVGCLGDVKKLAA